VSAAIQQLSHGLIEPLFYLNIIFHFTGYLD
jgi:hypothetical protein